MTRPEIIQKIQLCLDEVTNLSDGTTMMDPQIEGQLDAAAVSLLRLLPAFLGYPIGEIHTAADGAIELPPDFIKLAMVKGSEWKTHVDVPLPASHPRVRYQYYKNLAATALNPLVYITSRNEIKYLHVAPPSESYKVDFVIKPTVAEELNDDLVDMLAWHCAEIIYGIHGELNQAAVCRQRLDKLIEAAQRP